MTTLVVEWTLSWLWQGCMLTLIVAGLLRVTTGASATTRFLAWWATLAAVLLLGAAPFAGTPGTLVPAGSLSGLADVVDGAAPTPLFPLTVPTVPTWFGVTLALGWFGFVGVRSCKLALSLRRLRSIKRASAPLPDGIEQDLPLWLNIRAQGRPAELRLSRRIATAAMLGLGSPVIALPPQLVDSVSRADLDRVVLHEYGHVQRRDDWSMIAQALIDTVFGWHPAIWWIGRQLHLEREVASDDWVARHTSKPHEFAACLARISELVLVQRDLPHAARAVRSRRELSGRVERLLTPARNVTSRPAGLALTTGAFTLVGAVWLLGCAPPLITSAAYALQWPVPSAPFVAAQPPSLAQVGRRVPIPDVSGGSVPGAKIVRDEQNLTADVEIQAIPLVLGATIQAPQIAKRVTSPLQSIPLRIDGRVSAPRAATRTLGSRAGPTGSNDGPRGPWTRVAGIGKALGANAAEAGQVTASAFQRIGSTFARVFSGG